MKRLCVPKVNTYFRYHDFWLENCLGLDTCFCLFLQSYGNFDLILCFSDFFRCISVWFEIKKVLQLEDFRGLYSIYTREANFQHNYRKK